MTDLLVQPQTIKVAQLRQDSDFFFAGYVVDLEHEVGRDAVEVEQPGVSDRVRASTSITGTLKGIRGTPACLSGPFDRRQCASEANSLRRCGRAAG